MGEFNRKEIFVNDEEVSTANRFPITRLESTDDSVEVFQSTHDNLNANANIQINNIDVSNSNSVPINDAGGSITVDATDLDIRDLKAPDDNVAISDGVEIVEVNADGSINIVTNTEYDEDTAHTSGDTGQFILVVRNDDEGSLVDTNGDYAPLQVDELGRLRVILPGEDDTLEKVQEYESPGTGRNKINYSVPANKRLFIQQWHVSVSEGTKNIFELQDDAVGVASIGNGENGGGGGTMLFPDDNPIGPFAAGSTIRVRREEGDAGKDWSTGFIGFLEDV